MLAFAFITFIHFPNQEECVGAQGSARLMKLGANGRFELYYRVINFGALVGCGSGGWYSRTEPQTRTKSQRRKN